MSNRTSGILSQMRERRLERKKPKRFVELKKVSLDVSQYRGISNAQANLPKHPITQKHVGRSSAALTVAMGFHILIAIIISFFYIKDRIESEREIFDISFVKEEAKTKRRFQVKETLKFDKAKQEQQKPVFQPLAPTDTKQSPLNQGFVIPDIEATDDLSTTGPDEGLKPIDVDQSFVKPITPIKPDPKTPVPELKREPSPLINKFDASVPDEGLNLDSVSFESEPGVVPPKKKFQVEPDYPESAKKAEKEGEVILQATVDEKGNPKDIKALTNLGFGFEAAAIAALKKSTFHPATKGGQPVSKLVQIGYKFTLKDN